MATAVGWTLRDGVLSHKTLEDIVCVTVEKNQHRAGCCCHRWWNGLATEGSQQWAGIRATIIDKHVIIGTFRSHFVKTQCDVELAGVSSNEPLAVRVITVAVIAISDDSPGSSEDLAMAVAGVRWLGDHWARQATYQQQWHQQ